MLMLRGSSMEGFPKSKVLFLGPMLQRLNFNSPMAMLCYKALKVSQGVLSAKPCCPAGVVRLSYRVAYAVAECREPLCSLWHRLACNYVRSLCRLC